MIRLQWNPVSSVDDARALLQIAIGVEFGTLPPYLYALFSIPPGRNGPAASRLQSVALQEMIHMCLDCNILNALGGSPLLVPPVYPGPLPGDIGPPDQPPLIIHLLRLSEASMAQGMSIEEPEEPIHFPIKTAAAEEGPESVTIGEFYRRLDEVLSTLPASAWIPNRNQIDDSQFFAGQLFPINNYNDAHAAIEQIVSEGEGTPKSPLDFQEEIAHYYRFGEVFYNKVLTKDPGSKLGYTWGPEPLGVDWAAVYPAIPDPCTHDFSHDPPDAQAAQKACNDAYTTMVDELRLAVNGDTGRLGNAVQAMFELRMAARAALHAPLSDPNLVAGPSFLYTGAKS